MIRDQLILNLNDDAAREKILDKAQLDENVPSLSQVIGLLKNYESRNN